jgi:cytochrome c553
MNLKLSYVLGTSILTAGLLVAGEAVAQAAGAAQGTSDKGATVYAAQKCSLCHGMDGKGNQKAALDDVGSKLTADQIRAWILTPVEMAAKANATRKPVMKPYPNLPKEDLDSLVAFLAAKKKK